LKFAQSSAIVPIATGGIFTASLRFWGTADLPNELIVKLALGPSASEESGVDFTPSVLCPTAV
jgi:hypothetical protein